MWPAYKISQSADKPVYSEKSTCKGEQVDNKCMFTLNPDIRKRVLGWPVWPRLINYRAI